MEQHKTHWKKLTNPDYIGAYALEPGQELILTIETVVREVVTGTDGKKEECTVAHFHENVKPMILNATNSKTIQKIYKTPYIEDWVGRKIQIFATPVRVGKETVDALRIRPSVPQQTNVSTKCTDCAAEIQPAGKLTAQQVAQYTYQRYGKPLCSDCATAEIQPAGKLTAQQVAQYTYQRYGKPLCSDCATKAKAAEDAQKITDPLAEPEQNNSEQDGEEE
jgi:hypothetical protein